VSTRGGTIQHKFKIGQALYYFGRGRNRSTLRHPPPPGPVHVGGWVILASRRKLNVVGASSDATCGKIV
jgi:hypothetical protein